MFTPHVIQGIWEYHVRCCLLSCS